LKSCQSGERVKKAAVFTFKELEEFIQNRDHSNKYWMVRKAVIACAFFGGHRTWELRHLNLEDLEYTDEGVVVTFERAKQRKCPEDSKYLIPTGKNNIKN
jgi:site-specific recombinase XerD